MKIRFSVLIPPMLLLFAAASAFGEPAPPSAGELAYRLISPFYLGGGTHITKTETPQGTYLNPAMAAGFQRITLDVNYANLQRLDPERPAAAGHAGNIAGAFPTRFGVFTGSLGFLAANAFERTPMALGSSGHLNLAFSKKIYSDIWFGLGLTGELGEIGGVSEGGGALNLGFLHFPDKLWGLKNFSWGLTLNGIGYRFGGTERGYLNAVPGNITPAGGVAFDIVSLETFRWSFRSDLRIPSVSDLMLGITSDFHLGRLARFSVSSSITLRDALAGSWQTFIPALSLGFNFNLDSKRGAESERFRSTEMDIQAAAAPLYDDVWAFSGGLMLPFGVRDTKPPEISVDYQNPQYISPNYDGTQDELLIPYTAKDERYITGYRWRVLDESGGVIRTYVNKDERPENESVSNLMRRLVSPREGTSLPESFRWDGVTDAGSPAPDGEYQVYLEFRDDNGNRAEAGPFTVVVDTLPPELRIENPQGRDRIFSPDGDGLKDRFILVQEGSREHRWEAVFENAAGAPVKRLAWSDDAPSDVEWDGRDDSGAVVPDGIYRYTAESADRAGNAVSASVEGIIIDTQRPRIGLTVDRGIFSPETPGAFSELTFTPEIPVTDGIIGWDLTVLTSEGRRVKTWPENPTPVLPGSVVFPGRDDSGRRLPEGEYRGVLSIEYANGYRTETESPNFVVDITPPEARVSANWPLFSPQSGSRRDDVTFIQDASPERRWTGELTDARGVSVRRWEWIAVNPESLVWDGRDAEGRLVPDGKYRYTLSAVDEAGNSGSSPPVTVTVDTSAVEASLTASLDVFGPTGSGTQDTVSLFIGTRSESPAAEWTLTVSTPGGRAIRSWNGRGAPPESVIWDGRGEQGEAVSDGEYRASLSVVYEKGDVAEASTGAIRVDTVAPEIDVRITEPILSPDDDGRKDSLAVRQNSSAETAFEARILDSGGRPVRLWVWSGKLDSFEWDGRDDSGNLLPDGEYRYIVSGTDEAGNRTEKEIPGIRIDTAPTPLYLTAEQGYIRAGETDPERRQSFTAVIPNDTGVLSWSLSVDNENGESIYTESGDGLPPGELGWNGTDREGRPLGGIFTGVLTLIYSNGAEPRAETRPFVSDSGPPRLDIALSPQPFSPDGDNVDDELVIAPAVEDQSPIAEWSLAVSDPRAREFITFSGRGRPSERIIWDGRSGRGELVQSAEDYPYVFTVTDILGMSSVEEGRIAVDVLVIREGDRLKIQINNITFQPSSPRLTLTGEEGEKNTQVLDRLAEIMRKYGSYRIAVEGHAVSLNWANPSAARREQQDILIPLSLARARTVVDELISRGIPAARMSAAGIGGEKPIVPHGDLEERWRNRRVEFYLEK